MTLNHLSDGALVTALHGLCLDAQRLDARFIIHLVEVEDRRLHLRAACSSLFDFCVRRLHLSEGAAFRRINAARLVRRFPSLLGHIERGAVNLSTLVLLRDHFMESTVDELVAATSKKTKLEVAELLARRAPRPDVPSKIRKLPVPAASFGAACIGPVHAPSPTPRPATRIEPLSESRYKVQLTVSAGLRAKLERAKDLTSHRNPNGDLAVVMEQALDALLEKLEKERLARSSRPRRPLARPSKRGHITAAVRREVFARDGEQCTYVDAEGCRCPSRAFLELDHVEPRALGGSHGPENLRVTCRAHNHLHAEDIFGREHVARMTHVRQRKSESHGRHPDEHEDARAVELSRDLRPRAAPSALDAATHGLVRLGFGKRAARDAVGVVSARYVEAATPPLPEVLREALALLTSDAGR
jgi:5-methylcytosine-specific restriction endonuclease McrA